MVILLVALVVLGPEQLPKAMRTFGNVMAEIRKVSGGFQAEMRKAMDSIDDSGNDKPQSAKPDSGQPASAMATTMEEADVTEVVARNTDLPAASDDVDADSSAVTTEPASSNGSAASEPDSGRPAIDPADRAAG